MTKDPDIPPDLPPPRLSALQHAVVEVFDHFGPVAAKRPVEQVQEWLDRITYKPGFRFTASDVGSWYVAVRIEFWATDSTRGLTTMEEALDVRNVIPLRARVTMPVYMTDRDDFTEFCRWFEHELRYLERHEFDEWLRVDGKLLHDPHANEGRG